MKIKSFECPKSIRYYEKKKYLEHQALGRRVVCPISPANQRIILQIVGFLLGLVRLHTMQWTKVIFERTFLHLCFPKTFFFHFPVFVLTTYVQFFKISFENCKHGPKPKYYFNQKGSYPVLLEAHCLVKIYYVKYIWGHRSQWK